MTENRSARPADDDRGPAVGTPDVVGYRWTCPFCDSSRSNPAGEEADERNAVTALRSHILASADDHHGRSNAYPEGFDPSTLTECVVGIDRGGEPVGSER